MIKRIFHKIIPGCIFLASVTVASAQSKTTVKAGIDRNKILIGEPVLLTLEANIPENEPIRFFYLDSIPHFEFLEKQKIDTANTTEGTILTQVIRITSFDSGHWVIPSLVLRDSIATDTLPVDVSFSTFNPELDYHDIKDIIEVNPKEEKKDRWFWYAIAGGALLLVVLLIYFLRKKKPAIQASEQVIDPYEEAMKQLEKLAREKPDQKQYYSRLVDIFRVYVLKKKEIRSMQKTTDDLVIQLKGVPLAKDQFEKLAQALRLSDFVKFAKYTPSGADDQDAMDIIKKTISEIEQIK
jgi:hypothetical protein